MVATPRGLITGGDATTQGGDNVGRIAQFDFSSVPASNGVETAITEPIMGRVENSGQSFDVKGTASVTTGTVNRVEVSIQREGGAYLQDDLTTWSGTANTINAPLADPGAASTTWTLADHRARQRQDGRHRAHRLQRRDGRQLPGDEEVRDLQPRRRPADGVASPPRPPGRWPRRRSPSPAHARTTRAWSR